MWWDFGIRIAGDEAMRSREGGDEALVPDGDVKYGAAAWGVEPPVFRLSVKGKAIKQHTSDRSRRVKLTYDSY